MKRLDAIIKLPIRKYGALVLRAIDLRMAYGRGRPAQMVQGPGPGGAHVHKHEYEKLSDEELDARISAALAERQEA